MCGYDTDRRQTLNGLKRGVCIGEGETVSEADNMVRGARVDPTCAAAAKVIAHGNVQPLAWNMGKILNDRVRRWFSALERRRCIARTHHKYVDSRFMLLCCE